MTRKEVALHRGNDGSAGSLRQAASWSTPKDYTTGSLIAGVIFAVVFGLMFVHGAVFL